MSDPKLMKDAALYLMGSLLPEYLEERLSGVYLEVLNPVRYARLTTQGKAIYDLAHELWLGNGPLSRFILSADGQGARVLQSAITVACGPITLDMA